MLQKYFLMTLKIVQYYHLNLGTFTEFNTYPVQDNYFAIYGKLHIFLEI